MIGPPEKWDKETDVVIVGFGGSGAAAAIEAADAGAAVIILEKMSQPGGSTAMSDGGIYVGGSPVQRALGIIDSAEEVCKFYMAVGKHEVDPGLVRILAESGPAVYEWLTNLGVGFPVKLRQFHQTMAGLSLTGNERYPEYEAVIPPKPRSHWCEGGGQALFAALKKAVDEREVTVMLGTPAKELIVNQKGEVVGVKAESKRKELCIRARKAVILACGSTGHDKEIVRGLPMSYAATVTVADGCTGDGIRMATQIGAFFRAIDGGINALPREMDLVRMYLNNYEKLPRIIVNKKGKRYTNEDYYMSMQALYLSREEDMESYVIIDEDGRNTAGLVDEEGRSVDSLDLSEEIAKGVVTKADSLGSLAETIEIDPTGLEETVTTWNTYVKLGEDREFGRKYALRPIRTPPFYAFRLELWNACEAAGIKTDTKSRVIDVSGRVIPRLYAVGILTAEKFGTLYPGCGVCISDAICFGRIAGKSAAAEASLEP